MINAYDPSWAIAYNNLSAFLKNALHDVDIDIQHVGSTAIPGLAAKPILDIDIIIQEKQLLQKVESTLIDVGYTSKGTQGIAGRFAFRQTSDTTPHNKLDTVWMPHHLYVCFADSLALKNHLLFRDALLKDRALALAYESIKHKISDSHLMTRKKYTRLKTDFILSVLKNAGLSPAEIEKIRAANK
jgi:GrpB-like predicted nucleotidyltransferase (UPF0157 family)